MIEGGSQKKLRMTEGGLKVEAFATEVGEARVAQTQISQQTISRAALFAADIERTPTEAPAPQRDSDSSSKTLSPATSQGSATFIGSA